MIIEEESNLNRRFSDAEIHNRRCYNTLDERIAALELLVEEPNDSPCWVVYDGEGPSSWHHSVMGKYLSITEAQEEIAHNATLCKGQPRHVGIPHIVKEV